MPTTILDGETYEQAEPKCNPHPDAPHGFDRNASHSANRYVCECEGWELEQAEQEPVARHICNLWVDPITKEYVVDHCDHPIEELIPAYNIPQIDITDNEYFVKQLDKLTDEDVKSIHTTLTHELWARNIAPVRTKDLTEQQALEKLCNYINQNFKTQKEAAKSFEVTEGFLSMVLNGKKPITKEMAHRLSLTRQTMFLELTSPASGKAAPVRTKDLTDDEINEVLWRGGPFETVLDATRAVIAAYKEKNK